MTRTYDQLCPVAVTLDLVGDRWTLLILRDLLWRGPHGFQELIESNPGLSPTVLSERLRDLVDEGMVERLEVRHGRRSAVYRLTEAGQRIEPVIAALYEFGGDALATTPLTPAKVSYIVADAARAAGDRIFDLPNGVMRIVIDDVEVDVTLGPGVMAVSSDAGRPTTTVEMDQAAFVALVSGETSPAMSVAGDPSVAEAAMDVLRRS